MKLKYKMTNHEWLNYKIEARERLRSFMLKILELSETFPKSERGRIVNNQLTRSGSSTYANYRVALRGRSKKEFFAKLSIAVEEADETEMWLDVVIASESFKSNFVIELHKESLERLKILALMRKRASE